MRISNKMIYSHFIYNAMRSEEIINNKNNQISTGKRIMQPSDDPVGTTRAMDFRTRGTEMAQYIDNSERAISWLNATDDALMTLTNDLQRVRELVIAGANGSLTTEAREAYAAEIDKIRDGIMQIANTTIDNRYIFGGEKLLEAPYQSRTTVTGNQINFQLNPIVLTDRNNQISVKLDDGQFVNISLTPKTYNGSAGNTLDDLADDIQLQLRKAGFDVPVSVKATPDKRLVFYAGTQPAKEINTLVLEDGPAIKEVGAAQDLALPADQIALAGTANGNDDYYNGWRIMITEGQGAGQVRTITDYTGATNLAQVDSNWAVQPNGTSKYRILPPLEGTASVTAGGNTIDFDIPAGSLASDIDNFYNGMDITIYNEETGFNETFRISKAPGDEYDGGTHVATILGNWTSSGTFKYKITPHVEGQVVNPAGNQFQLEDPLTASDIDDFYNGASVTITNADGSTETRRIIDYDSASRTVTLDSAFTTNVTVTSTYKIADTTLSQLGFNTKATTKELLGGKLDFPLQVLAKYPETGAATGGGAGFINLGASASTIPDYYNNWTIAITNGTGMGQTRTISGYAGGVANVLPAWDINPGADSEYSLTPPLTGQIQAVSGTLDQVTLDPASRSAIDDFYVGMPLTITDGNGKSQTRIITDYDQATGVATLDSAWGSPPPTAGSSYSIDAQSYINANNKFKITVGNELTQEISLDAGCFTAKEFAKMIETKIQARGGEYGNIKVQATPDDRLRIVHQNVLDDPLPIKLESGSEANALWILGFSNGASSETPLPNYEGNKGGIEYEISVGMRSQINIPGDKVFDPIFQHLTRISMNLRSDNVKALSEVDLRDIRLDIDNVLVTQGEVGAKVNRLEKGIDRLKSLDENLTKLLSNVEDADITKVIIDLKMQEVAYQAALQAAGRIMPMSLLDYLR